MSKHGEIKYLARGGPDAAAHALDKPFSDPQCGALLADIAGIMLVLPPTPARILDLGCGSGWTSVFLARRGYDVVGQDIAPDMLALAEENRQRAGLRNLEFVASDYESLPYQSEFDVALFYDALHHAVDPRAAIGSAYRALKPGGVMVTLEPGVGHGASEVARQAVAAFDVTERDMPPRLVVAIGRDIGFGRAAVYPMPKVIAALQYRSRVPWWWPRRLGSLHQWLGIGWANLVVRGTHGGLVVLWK